MYSMSYEPVSKEQEKQGGSVTNRDIAPNKSACDFIVAPSKGFGRTVIAASVPVHCLVTDGVVVVGRRFKRKV